MYIYAYSYIWLEPGGVGELLRFTLYKRPLEAYEKSRVWRYGMLYTLLW